MLREYLEKISRTMAQGDAREESYYSQIEELIDRFAEETKRRNIHVTTIPRKTEAGNPDFRIWDGKQHIVGYIEAKTPDKNLDEIQTTDQLQRYIHTFPNLILTNFYEFRLFRDGNLFDRVLIGQPILAKEYKTIPPIQNETEFYSLLEKFFTFSLPKTFTASSLASELAKRTRFLKDEIVIEELTQETEGKGDIAGFYEAFKRYLISGLTQEEFADLYSQTVTYGLFAARTRANEQFNRELAFKYIPPTIGILKDIFRYISLGQVSLQMQVIIDDIAEVLQAADINKILHQFYVDGKGQDPIIHFYETFLSKYDPELREKRGVYYTPEPVVGYIVRSVHQLLKNKFKLNDGLASEEVTLLDPAGGTLTFPAEAIKVAVKEFTTKYGEGGIRNFIKNHILKNYYAFELMMAPYAIGHLKIGFLLEELGYRLEDDDRFKLYLTNTLETDEIEQINIPGISSLSEESKLAGRVKKREPILAIIGNPPYSGISANVNEWTEKLLKEDMDGAQSYYIVDGESLGERNPKWLQDDYVKFLRFAQWKIHKAGKGIVGMITNHSYLDNPTFRGMRQSLMQTFNEIYIIDLHGNSLKNEKTPDGGKDENVFDIQQGTAISLFIKDGKKKKCRVFHSELFGLRQQKYNWLVEKTLPADIYKDIEPTTPYYFLVERNVEKIKHFLKWKKINDIFPVNSVGIITARDKLTINWTADQAWNTVMSFSTLDADLARQAYQLGEDTRDWKVELAQRDIKDTGFDRDKIVPILYRPYDIRYTYYTGKSRGFHCMPRPEVMRHMLDGDNLGIICVRQVAEGVFNHTLITDVIIESRITLSNKGIAYLHPLYLHPEKDKKKQLPQTMILFEPEKDYKKKTPNIDKVVYSKLVQTYQRQIKGIKKKISPESILFYIYALLHSNIYRGKYAEFLKYDFPRIPFTSDYVLFQKLSLLGEKLVNLHLMKTKELDHPKIRYMGSGENDMIEKVEYIEKEKRVFINRDKYFEDISPEIWNFCVGGYQVMNKYLKDRKGRSMEDPRHYCRIAASIYQTMELQRKIDLLFDELEKEEILDMSS
jgi:predicted helicase